MGLARSISVVVPAYNEMGNLEGAVRDVVHALQSFDEFEVIIVNDGSKDGTGEVADRLAEILPNVRVIHHEVNRGFSESYRTGLKNARMSYFTFVPGDHEVANRAMEHGKSSLAERLRPNGVERKLQHLPRKMQEQ